MKRNFFFALISSLIILLSLAACGGETATLRPVEEEQIENVVKEFMVREETIPEYEVTIEEATEGWARVSLMPAAVEEGQPIFLYLHKQTAEGEAEPAAVSEQVGNDGRVTTTTGWNIVLGPQASFSEAELNEAGVPDELR